MAKTRGSTKGLQAHYRDKEQATQDALVRAYEALKQSKPHSVWTKAELWRGAGMKSGNALANPRHSNIVALFERHNADARDQLKAGPIAVSERKTTRETVRALRDKIAATVKQRDMAASQNAIFEREALYFKQQYEDMLVLNKRLERERDDWREKYFEANKPRGT